MMDESKSECVPVRKCPSCNEIMYIHPIKSADDKWVFYCYCCDLLINDEKLKQILEGER